jgi:hypothetical protein
LKGAILLDPGLIANVRLGWKTLSRTTNTLAYFHTSLTMMLFCGSFFVIDCVTIFHPSLMFVEKAGATQVEHLKVLAFRGRLLALSANIIPRWKSLPGTNALAYFTKHQ